jgi:hypothetical protein
MKTFRLSIILLLLLGAISCKKTDSSTTDTSVTTDQAADIAAGSLSVNSNGLASVSDDISANAQTMASVNTGSQSVNSTGLASVHQACGSTVTDSVSRQSPAGATAIFNYFFKYSRTLNCNVAGQSDNLVNSLIYHGSFDGPNLSSSNSGNAAVTIAGLTTTATHFVVNGQYKRIGSFQSKVGNKNSGQDTVSIVATNITLTKPDRKISGGTATIAVSGVTSKHGSFKYNGTIVFNGDGTATLTINGAAYAIDMVTGFKTKH